MILAPFGGVFADRLDKRLAMMVARQPRLARHSSSSS